MADMHSPMEQFEIKRLLHFKIVGVDASYTNSAAWMTVAVICAFLCMPTTKRRKARMTAMVIQRAELV